MLNAPAEKKGRGSFLRTLCGRTGPGAGAGLTVTNPCGGVWQPCPRHGARTGRSPVKRPPYLCGRQRRSALRRVPNGGVLPRHLAERHPNGDGRDPDP